MSAFADTIFAPPTDRPQPGPRRLRMLIPDDEVYRHRDFDCALYGDCLDRAAIENWTSWSCAGCPMGCLAPTPSPAAPKPARVKRAPGPSRRARIAELITGSAQPLNAQEIAEELELDDPVGILQDLHRLARSGEAVRVGPGTYVRASSAPGGAAGVADEAPPPPPPPAPSLEDQVLEVIAGSAKPLTAPQVAVALEEGRVHSVANALSKLAQAGRIRRVGRGFYGRVVP